jgi:hypothetical protein
MATSFDEVEAIFLAKVSDHNIIGLGETLRTKILDRNLLAACEMVNNILPNVDLTRDTSERQFLTTLDTAICELLALGMICEWLKPQVLDTDKLRNVMRTRDIQPFSPAELLGRIRELQQSALKEFRNAVNAYSYRKGDLA